MNSLWNLWVPIIAIVIIEILKKVCEPKSYFKKILLLAEVYLVLYAIYIPLLTMGEYQPTIFALKKTYPILIFSTIPLAITIISVVQLIQYSRKLETIEKKQIIKKSRIIVGIIITTCLISTITLIMNWANFEKIFGL